MCLLYEKKNYTAFIKYNRPRARNAFSPELILRVAEAMDDINADDGIRVVVLGSTTPGVFSAGADLKLTIPLLCGDRAPETDADHQMLNDLSLYRKGTLKSVSTNRPIIAAVDGFCLAAAFEAVLGTDIRIATARSRFGLPEVTRGIVAMGGGTSKLPRQIPFVRAMEMNLTGRHFTAEEMLRYGFLNDIVDEDSLWERAEEMAGAIAENAPLGVRAAKESIWNCLGYPISRAMDVEYEITKHIRSTEDAKEGPRAFAEKRRPVWQAR